MKYLLLISISLLSLNLFSSELGENSKTECPFLNQTSKRDAKIVILAPSEVVKEGSKVISK